MAEKVTSLATQAYEKIKENFDGSALYFDNAIKYLIEKAQEKNITI